MMSCDKNENMFFKKSLNLINMLKFLFKLKYELYEYISKMNYKSINYKKKLVKKKFKKIN